MILFEFCRVLIILFLFFAIFYYPINKMYHLIGIETDHYLLVVTFALLLIIFVIYSNKFQFTGFYTKGSKKLPNKVTWAILSIAFLLLVIPIIIHFL
ncbi:hypothetical protein ACIQ4I_09015 [Rummeliibacillus sp. NPDC094406]|uniref:hypothetical protein n=1 Tax=Rummeliibacillus sp. NPDC094406 TaxID=3364511 RepID=UPI003824B6C6